MGELNRDSYAETEKPTEDFLSESNHQEEETEPRTIRWTLSCLDGKIDPKAYERLKSEIEWAEVTDEGTMIFKSTDAAEIDAFSKKIRTIFAESEQHNIVKAFSFSITSPR